MDDRRGLNELNAEQFSQIGRISKGKHIVGAFAVELFSFDSVDVREDGIDCRLREVVKRIS